ncbi:MAG: NADH-quinone oxidoreductase subunit N, partial [Prevotella sp.]|nr:NADH-quinone oxidoreductase subunit N [Prevotella sp.]
MIPEATLVAILIILFIADFALSKSEKRHSILRTMTLVLVGLQMIPCITTGASTAFAGMYFTTPAVGAMKVILTGGTLVVLLMAQPWLQQHEVSRRYEGEFYMLVVSTLLGMYMMMSSGHFL